MKRIRILCGTLALLTLAAGATSADGPAPVMLAYTCAGCHGTHGPSAGPSCPSIAGMDTEYFIDSMNAYKEDARNSTIMNRIAKGYSDEQIAGMAQLFAMQKPLPPAQKYHPALVKVGAKLHQKYCENCHEEGGRRAGESGTLAGQWMPYLQFSMADFQAGHREMPNKMKRKLEGATKEQGDTAIQALLHYRRQPALRPNPRWQEP